MDSFIQEILKAMLASNLEGAAAMLRIGNYEMLRVELENALGKCEQLKEAADADRKAAPKANLLAIDV